MKKREIEKIEKPKQKSINADFFEIVKGYYSFSSAREKVFDGVMPVIISLTFFIIISLVNVSNTEILNVINDINTIALSVMTILAGFNTTSLAIIASTNRELLQQLFDVKTEKSHSNILKQVVTFFTFAIMLQIVIVAIGIVIALVNSHLYNIYLEIGIVNWPLARSGVIIFGFIWISVILYSLFISIRNISLLYRYVLFLGKKEDRSN